MKNLIIATLLTGLITLTGCAGASGPNTAVFAVTAFEGEACTIAEIPSHGAIGDGIALAAGGGAGNIESLRNMLLSLQTEGSTQRIAIGSSNDMLSRTVLKSAVKNLPKNSLSNIQIALMGQLDLIEEIREPVEATGAKLLAFEK